MSSNGCSCVPKQFYFPKEAAGLWATVCQPLDYTKVCSGVTQAKLKGKPQKYHTNPKDLNSTPEQKAQQHLEEHQKFQHSKLFTISGIQSKIHAKKRK